MLSTNGSNRGARRAFWTQGTSTWDAHMTGERRRTANRLPARWSLSGGSHAVRASTSSGPRSQRDGEELRWVMTIAEESVGATVLPFPIDWQDSPHFAATASGGLRLDQLVLLTPVPVRL
ncbi:MAG: VOC family protein [Acidimicrobiales bacterium]